jgi:hypothetical protein
MVLGVVPTGAEEWRRRLGVATEKRPTIGVRPLEEFEIPGSENLTFLLETVLGVLAGTGEEGMSHDGSGLMMLRRERLTAIGRLRSSMMNGQINSPASNTITGMRQKRYKVSKQKIQGK